jgi:hypothetical protein
MPAGVLSVQVHSAALDPTCKWAGSSKDVYIYVYCKTGTGTSQKFSSECAPILRDKIVWRDRAVNQFHIPIDDGAEQLVIEFWAQSLVVDDMHGRAFISLTEKVLSAGLNEAILLQESGVTIQPVVSFSPNESDADEGEAFVRRPLPSHSLSPHAPLALPRVHLL